MRIGVTVLVLTWLTVMSCYDIRQRRLPNWLTLPGAVLILLGGAWAGRGLPVLAGAAALGALYLLVHLAAPTGMGAGDVKLAVGLGGLAGCFGVEVWFLAALAAPVVTALWAGAAMLRGVRTVPHGPSMCLATAVVAGVAMVGRI